MKEMGSEMVTVSEDRDGTAAGFTALEFGSEKGCKTCLKATQVASQR